MVLHQPNPETPDFDQLPLFYLAKLQHCCFGDEVSRHLCKEGVPIQEAWH